MKRKKGWNADKHGCLQCKYQGFLGGRGQSNKSADSIFCDYLGKTGRSRSLICTGDDCTVFKRERRKKALKESTKDDNVPGGGCGNDSK